MVSAHAIGDDEQARCPAIVLDNLGVAIVFILLSLLADVGLGSSDETQGHADPLSAGKVKYESVCQWHLSRKG